MKRWIPYVDGMAEKPEGPYVLWEDYAEEVKRLQVEKYPGCKILSLGDACTCKICTLEKRAEAAEATAARERERAEDLERLFALQQTCTDRAIALWREATGKHDVLPDLGDLLDWLMSRIEALERCVRLARGRMRHILETASVGMPRTAVRMTQDVIAQLDALFTPAPSAEPSGEEEKT